MRKLVLIACALVLFAGVAHAQDDRRPPRSVLKQEATRQVGRLGTYCWSWSDEGGGGGGQCVDYFRHVWPRTKPGAKGEPTVITIKYPDPPSNGSLTYWRRVDEDKQPEGEGTDIPYVLAPRETDEGTVWDLTFDMPAYRGHFYLYGFQAWSEKGDASYHWHLRLE